MRTLLVFPALSGNNAGYHLPRLLQEVANRGTHNVRYATAGQLVALSREDVPQPSTDLMLNWLDTLYFHFVPRKLAALLSITPPPLRRRLSRRIAVQIMEVVERIRRRGIRVAFYYHDLHTFSRIPFIKDLDRECRSHFHRTCDAVLFAEESARACVEQAHPSHRPSFLCHMGSFIDYHGELLPSAQARHSLGIKPDQTVVFALGTIRSNRSIEDLVEAAGHLKDVFVLAAGRGNTNRSGLNVRTFGGYVSNEDIRTLLSCADYVINTGTNYLTSAAERVAISYGIPIVAYDFGSTTDMCRSALVPLKAGVGIDAVLATLPRRSTEQYQLLRSAALKRDAERTWELAASQLLAAFNGSETLGRSNSSESCSA
jgi:glycosyltransferase involved in cell wall biosynthesis